MRSLTFFVFLLTVCSLSGCHTLNGMGKDLQAAGEKISSASHK